MDQNTRLGVVVGKLDMLITDVRELKRDVKALNQFKWRVAGGAGVLAVFLSLVVELIHVYWKG